MSAYLLSCECGNSLPVEVGQAGGQVSCRCGAKLDVPPLRQLRHLPQAKVAEAGTSKSWGTRQGIVAASLIVVAGLLGWSAWSWWLDPVIPKFDPVFREHQVEEQIKTPVGAWEAWIAYYRPMAERGFPVFQPSNADEITRRIAGRRFLRRMLLSVAGIFVVVALAAAFWPAPVAGKTRRHGDKKTWRTS